jgi:hypothetical protein
MLLSERWLNRVQRGIPVSYPGSGRDRHARKARRDCSTGGTSAYVVVDRFDVCRVRLIGAQEFELRSIVMFDRTRR